MKVLITGASSGIGKDMARILGEKKHELVLVARDEEKLEQVRTEIEKDGAKVETISMDLSNADNCKTLHNMVQNVDIKKRNTGLEEKIKNLF